jgi:hypothetical protein
MFSAVAVEPLSSSHYLPRLPSPASCVIRSMLLPERLFGMHSAAVAWSGRRHARDAARLRRYRPTMWTMLDR